MNRIRFVCLLLAVVCVLSMGSMALAAQVDCDTTYCFTSTDFSDNDTLMGVCITQLPETQAGTVMLGSRVIREGDFVTMDFGAQYMGYCSDMTRTVAVGFATEEMQKVYHTVLEAQLAGLAISKAGVPGKEIDGAARKVIADAGYGQYFGHGYGHSLGLEIHESPSPNGANSEPIPENAVCSAEPGIYLPGKFGVRIEDVVIFTEEGHENITGSPKNLIII